MYKSKNYILKTLFRAGMDCTVILVSGPPARAS